MSGGDWKAMFGAAVKGDAELVRFYLDQGVDVDYSHPEFQETTLVATILAGQEEVAHLLLDRGADPGLESLADRLTPAQAARQVDMSSVTTRLASLGQA